MATPSAKEIYEQHIKPLPLVERLRLVEMIAHEIATAAEKKPTSKRSILELEGLGADLWEGIDAQEYVNELRKEWDHRS
ncbi:MAG: hypothetical protein V7641_759 [Blastocatellia bacterium]